MPIIACENLTHLYGVGTPFETIALDCVNFSVEQGEIVGIIGHTGSGKSTLIQHLNALMKPNSGKVFLDGQDVWDKKNKKKIRSVRFAVGLCFQYPEYQIFEETVFDEIAYGAKQMGLSSDEIKKRVYESMEYLELKRELETKSPFDLSGGQKRRVAIASIISMNPKVLILDEPCAGLDPKGRETILNLIKNFQQKSKNTVIFVSHSMEDVAKIADKVCVINKGKVAMSGSVKEVYSCGDELNKMGLDIPQITNVFLKLKSLGVDCKTDIYTVKQGEEEVKRLLREGAIK